jgi:butyrate kinase
MKILALNPGSTSTKIAVYHDEECVFQANIRHPEEELTGLRGIFEQYPHRLSVIEKTLENNHYNIKDFDALAARGGILRPLDGGVYLVNEEMCNDLKSCKYGEHVSNLAAVIAYDLGNMYNIPSFIVDPVSVDEFHSLARFSGLPELPRISLAHILNIRAAARETSRLMGIPFEKLRLVISHLGSGISVAAFSGGKMIDVNNANNEGPFALERAGTLPSLHLIKLCYSGVFTEKEMTEKIIKTGGIYAYLGTKDFSKVESMIREGDEFAELVAKAMCYQVAKEIGAMSTVLCGDVDRIVLTGGMANSRFVIEEIAARVGKIANVHVIPGEKELEALAMGVLRIYRGEERVKHYSVDKPFPPAADARRRSEAGSG